MNEETKNSVVEFEHWFENQKVSEFEGVNANHVYDAWSFQQAKIDKLEKSIKYLMDNVDIPRYELEFCGLIEKEVE